jgi:hypothetical protein
MCVRTALAHLCCAPPAPWLYQPSNIPWAHSEHQRRDHGLRRGGARVQPSRCCMVWRKKPPRNICVQGAGNRFRDQDEACPRVEEAHVQKKPTGHEVLQQSGKGVCLLGHLPLPPAFLSRRAGFFHGHLGSSHFQEPGDQHS